MSTSNRLLTRAEKPGFVYFAQRSDGLTKIGYSVQPERRRHELQKTMKQRVRLLHSIAVDDMPSFEEAFHYNARNVRITGEWFNLTAAYLSWVLSLKSLRDDDDAWVATTINGELLNWEAPCNTPSASIS